MLTSAPYLTTKPNDGTVTGGGQLKLVAAELPDLKLRDRISVGEGRHGARFSLKKLDSGKISMTLQALAENQSTQESTMVVDARGGGREREGCWECWMLEPVPSRFLCPQRTAQ